MTESLETEIIRIFMLKNSTIKTEIGSSCEDFHMQCFPFDIDEKKGLGIYYKN